MKRLGALAVSPDGRWFVMAVTEPAYDEEQRRSDLWLVAERRQRPRRDGSPRAAPRKAMRRSARTRRAIAFTAKRDDDDAAQVYVLDLAGGEARRVTNWPGGARAPRFSPDGRSILFVGLDLPGAITRGRQPQGRRRAQGAQVQRARLRQLPDPPLGSLARRAAPLADGAAGGRHDARRATCSPASALRSERGFGGRLGNEGDTIEATWTPDGRGVVFAATTNRHEAARAEVHLVAVACAARRAASRGG